jgi:hypothetical protein
VTKNSTTFRKMRPHRPHPQKHLDEEIEHSNPSEHEQVQWKTISSIVTISSFLSFPFKVLLFGIKRHP